MIEPLNAEATDRLIRVIAALEGMVSSEMLDADCMRVLQSALGIEVEFEGINVRSNKIGARKELANMNRQLRRSVGDDLAGDE